jgi:hypothetical protein
LFYDLPQDAFQVEARFLDNGQFVGYFLSYGQRILGRFSNLDQILFEMRHMFSLDPKGEEAQALLAEETVP